MRKFVAKIGGAIGKYSLYGLIIKSKRNVKLDNANNITANAFVSRGHAVPLLCCLPTRAGLLVLGDASTDKQAGYVSAPSMDSMTE